MSSTAGRKLLGLAGAAALVFVATNVLTAASALARPMTFRLVPLSDPHRCRIHCAEVISANGEIVDSTPQDYLRFLQRHENDRRMRMMVFLNSPGGKVVASMKFGTLLRSSGALAIVARVQASAPGSGRNAAVGPGQCYSACVYALMGGKKRVIPPDSVAGIHRMFNYGPPPDPDSMDQSRRKIYDTGPLETELEKYASTMGVSRRLVTKADGVSANSIHILTPRELRRWRLAVRKF